MKGLALVLGMTAGAAITVTSLCMMYPDVSRRMMRDGKRVISSIGQKF